jgi:putative transposase
MSAHDDITAPLEPGCFYHIYNRGNDWEKVFVVADNYVYFLKKLSHYMSGYICFYSYCLLPDHFHLLVRVKQTSEVMQSAHKDFASLKDFEKKTPAQFVSEKFRRFFLSYSKSINKQEKRTGSLFQKNFRRRKIDHEDHLKALIGNIHSNPVYHKITKDFECFEWSSYKRILHSKQSKLEKKEVLSWFGGKEKYEAFHKNSNRKDSDKGLYIIE